MIRGRIPPADDPQFTDDHHLALMMTSAQVLENNSVNVTDNGSSQDYTNPDIHTLKLTLGHDLLTCTRHL